MSGRRLSLPELLATTDEQWREVFRVDALSIGLYTLEAGAADPQGPHAEDEIYYVVEGRAKLLVEGASLDAGAGDILYVPAGAEHRFVEIEERLRLLVVFAPAESDA